MPKLTTGQFLAIERAISEALCKAGGHVVDRVDSVTFCRLAQGVSIGGVVVIPHIIASVVDVALNTGGGDNG